MSDFRRGEFCFLLFFCIATLDDEVTVLVNLTIQVSWLSECMTVDNERLSIAKTIFEEFLPRVHVTKSLTKTTDLNPLSFFRIAFVNVVNACSDLAHILGHIKGVSRVLVQRLSYLVQQLHLFVPPPGKATS